MNMWRPQVYYDMQNIRLILEPAYIFNIFPAQKSTNCIVLQNEVHSLKKENSSLKTKCNDIEQKFEKEKREWEKKIEEQKKITNTTLKELAEMKTDNKLTQVE